MGEVVRMPIQGRRRAATPPPEGSAQILFFLGVRYCRDADDEKTAKKGRKASAPRSRRKKRA